MKMRWDENGRGFECDGWFGCGSQPYATHTCYALNHPWKRERGGIFRKWRWVGVGMGWDGGKQNERESKS
jgi:hypothetical protein